MRYLMTFSYNGNYFNGYQRQKNLKTVQGSIEKVLSDLNNAPINIYASGRTDVGVHAINAKAHFDMDKDINIYNIRKVLNKRLNGEIYIKDIELVSNDFHARYNVIKKEYHYYINTGEFNSILKDYVYQYNNKLDINEIKKCIKLFIGTHDFRSFCTDEKEKENCIRTIENINVIEHDKIIEIDFIGNGFLRHMVRNIVGILLKVGSNKIAITEVKKIIDNKNRNHNTKPAPSCGLYLWNVFFQ